MNKPIKEYVDSNFIDNKWFYRFADVKDINFDTEEELNSAFLKMETIKNRRF